MGRVRQRLGVAVGVNDHVARLGLEPQSLRLVAEQPLDELLEKETALRHAVGAFQLQLAVVLDKHGVA